MFDSWRGHKALKLIQRDRVMYYTGKGDDGKTSGGTQKERVTKDSIIPEALGTLDELNSFLGLCFAKLKKDKADSLAEIVRLVQEDLFVIQAELAGSDKQITGDRVKEIETIIDELGNEIPPITSFTIAGSTELSAHFDVVRTMARRAERRVVAATSKGAKMSSESLAYMNRLSSILFVMARFLAHKSGVKEDAPKY